MSRSAEPKCTHAVAHCCRMCKCPTGERREGGASFSPFCPEATTATTMTPRARIDQPVNHAARRSYGRPAGRRRGARSSVERSHGMFNFCWGTSHQQANQSVLDLSMIDHAMQCNARSRPHHMRSSPHLATGAGLPDSIHLQQLANVAAGTTGTDGSGGIGIRQPS